MVRRHLPQERVLPQAWRGRGSPRGAGRGGGSPPRMVRQHRSPQRRVSRLFQLADLIVGEKLPHLGARCRWGRFFLYKIKTDYFLNGRFWSRNDLFCFS